MRENAGGKGWHGFTVVIGVAGSLITLFSFVFGVPNLPFLFGGTPAFEADTSAISPNVDFTAKARAEELPAGPHLDFAAAFRQVRKHQAGGEYARADSILLDVQRALAATRHIPADGVDSLAVLASMLRAEVRRGCETEVALAVDRGEPSAVSCVELSRGGVRQ